MAIQDKHLEQADAIRASHDRRAEQIRARKELTSEAKTGLLARNYDDHKQRMDDLQQTATAETATRRRTLERSAFGIGDLPGDAGSNATSFRDAQDRAAALSTPSDAASLLARAERSGDEPLARAVAAHAFDQGTSQLGQFNSGWSEVLNSYLETRPGKAETVQKLADMDQGPSNMNSTRQLFAFVLPEPSETSSVPSGFRQQYIDAASKIA